MIAVVPGHDVTDRWRLVSRTATGADVLAIGQPGRGVRSRTALQRLRVGDGTVDVVRVGDAHFKWTLTDAEGRLIVESPAVYRGPESCRQAFTDAQHAARTALGGVPTQPSAYQKDRPGPSLGAVDLTHSDGRPS
jgi:hypothetical protein